MKPLAQLIERSGAFAAHLNDLSCGDEYFVLSNRIVACTAAAQLSIEHAHAVRTLFAVGTANSACAMSRAQYEALLRSAWAMYAATDLQIEKLNQPLGPESEQAAKNLPGAQDMLSGLKKKMAVDPALIGLVTPLAQIHEASWRAMNSFVHGGIHPLQRKDGGFPVDLATRILRNSNGMMHMAYRMLARMGQSVGAVASVDRAYLGFEDCVPMA